MEVQANYDVGAPSSLALCKHLTEHLSQLILMNIKHGGAVTYLYNRLLLEMIQDQTNGEGAAHVCTDNTEML